MISGKEKALILLTVLGPLGEDVLTNLDSQLAADLKHDMLRQNIQFAPQEVSMVVDEVMVRAEATAMPDPEFETPIMPEGPVVSESFDVAEAMEEEVPEPIEIREREEPESAGWDYRAIAAQLADQKPQIAAFFLSKLDKDVKQRLVEALPPDIRMTVENTKVEVIPISEKIYQSLHNRFFGSQN